MTPTEFTISEYTESQREAWDRVVRQSKNGNFLHLRDYMGYHAERFDEKSLLVLRKGEPVAVFPCNKVGETVTSHGGLTYGGLLYGPALHATDVMGIFELLIAHFRFLGVTTIVYRAVPHIFHRMPAEEDLYALFRYGARLMRRDLSSVVQLDQRLRLSHSKRWIVRKACSEGLAVRESEAVDDFLALQREVLKKHGAEPVHSSAELSLLKSRFPTAIRLFGAFRDDRLLAGVVTYDFGHVVHGQYAACSEEGRPLGALDMVLSHLLNTTFAERRFFSFGISTEQEGRYLNEGLSHQKEGLGGRAIVHDCYALDLTQ